MGLIGRDDELASLRAHLGRPGALLVVGEAGVGKTALLDEFAREEASKGRRVLRAGGAHFEAEVAYSTLNQLLSPLGEPDRLELRVALGFEIGPAPQRLVVVNALLGRLRALGPILLVVDDLQWADRASAEVLGFLARRLAGTGVSLLGSCRPGFDLYGGVHELELRALAPAAARTLVHRRFPDLAPAVRRRLLAEAAGNPLALLELPTALDGDQRRDFTTLPPVLPLPERLRPVFAAQVRALPDRCRRAMLLVALGGTTKPVEDDLAPAEAAGLVRIDATRARLRHPLIAAAVVEASAPCERRRAHAALAEAYRDVPERRARHLAESVTGADEETARELESAAHASLRRGDAIGAVAALTRAAELSTDPVRRGHRLAEAASIGADAGGEPAVASKLLGDARRTGCPDSLPAAVAAAHLLVNAGGDIPTAHRLLAATIGARDDATDPDLIEALHSLLLVSWWAGTDQAWQTFFTLLGRLNPAPPEELRLVAAIFSDPARACREDVAALDALIAGVRDGEDPTRLIRLGTAAVFADRLPALGGPERHLVQTGREGRGPARRHLGALMHLGLDGFLAGRWDEAWTLAEEGLALCAEHGLRFYPWYFQYVRALIAAGRGDTAAARKFTDELLRWAVARHAAGITHFAVHARALAELGAGDFESAYRHAARLSPPGRLLPHRPTALWSALDLVEAALHTGRTREAAAHAEALRDTGAAELSPRLRMLTTAAQAMTAADTTARELFEAAVSTPDAERWPFELGRIHYAYGVRLRRLRDTPAAREHLTVAHDLFTALDARTWRDRAAHELRATGRPQSLPATTPYPLTPQEREIAELAGAGLTNKQIGQKLFLSHRTVSDHLYKVFPKLGITSRAALRDALTHLDRALPAA
ncbi:AAA family ATPase [Actinoplanes sp. Pm04-4]|uniref:AAA family ATPase n=1 Tax=Paractinoplanes pyxinae TaxID=2997416 RepID=A0ABT4AS23_9ACTN|nr:LuxR family transcriptional regulator [Actinoplanes pyxinae]MCY1137031.1 AAA family ATPase [Actinoplanes pyxinae]